MKSRRKVQIAQPKEIIETYWNVNNNRKNIFSSSVMK